MGVRPLLLLEVRALGLADLLLLELLRQAELQRVDRVRPPVMVRLLLVEEGVEAGVEVEAMVEEEVNDHDSTDSTDVFTRFLK